MSEAQPQQARAAGGQDAAAPDRSRIVGIGASAGGLAALKTLFSGMPPDPGAAFVVVVHLAPAHESHLADLLQPHCPLPVLQVNGTVPVEPDRVYLIPPDRHLETIDTHLGLTALEAERTPPKPIDHFLCTLAASHDGDAIGVLLTGAGSDGTLGLRRVRERGGLTFVQDPQEAEYDGMPRSAVAAEVADRVLPLARIREEILRLCRSGERLAPTEDPPPGSDDTIGEILATMRARTGQDMSRYRRDALAPRIQRRMRLTEQDSPSAYLARLREHPEEVRALARDLLSTETAFFDGDGAFTPLAQQVIPRLFDAKRGSGEAVRVWSAGCSTGEEAYSLAILLLEEAARRDDPPQIRVFASDLNEEALGQAREGLYPAKIAARVGPERLARFFVHEAEHYRVRREVRDQVVFTTHHLLQDPPFPHLDLIVCRGVFGALTPDARKLACELFHYALAPGGFLLLGPAEAPPCPNLFGPTEAGAPLWRRREGRRRRRLPVAGFGGARPGAPQLPAAARPLPAQGHVAVHEQMAARHAPPSLLVDAGYRVVHYSALAGRYLKMPGGRPTHQLFELVAEPLRSALRRALDAAREIRGPWQSPPIVVQTETGPEPVALEVEPAGTSEGAALWFILFQPLAPEAAAAAPTSALERELALSRQRLTTALEAAARERERAQALDNELASITEEYRAVVEELESSSEELQSINEELATVNEENQHRIELLSQLTTDQQYLLEATGIATLFLDRALRIVRFTPQATALFNLRLEDRGRPLADLTHHLEHPTLEADARQALETLTPCEREVASDAGRWYLMRVQPYRAVPERVEGVVISLIDVTQRREAEERLRAEDRRKDQFLATLAHELRNPLAPIVTGLHLLELAGDDPRVIRGVCERLDRQTKQLVRLVDDLLDVSRITRGTFHLRIAPVALADAVRDAIAATEPFVQAKRHTLTVDLSAEALVLEADAARLTQVISNLLSNAAKYTPAGGRIRLRVERQGDQAVLSVSDSGIGIDPQRLESVFEMFTQIDANRHAGYGGLGIGLSLARNLVEMHNGTLTAHSAGPGTGSEFTVRLPLLRAPAAPAESAPARVSADLGGHRVLIADDNEDAASSLAMLVGMLGDNEVHTAQDGVEAVEKARALHPDIVVLDLGMPRMDGYEAARQIRSEPWGAAATLIALTGWGQEADRRRTREAGFDHHLLKPADAAALKAVFATARSGARQEGGDG